MEKVRIAVVGLNRGANLAKHILNYCQKKLDLVAVCDINREKADNFAKEHSIGRVYYSLDELLKAEDIEAVVLATPIPLHAEQVTAVLESGKHVLSEVVSALTFDECRKIQAAVKKSGKKYMLEENYCYYRPLTIVKNMADAGLLGDIYYAECDYLMDFNQRKGFPNSETWRESWRQKVYFDVKGHPYITHSLGPLSYIMNDKIKSVSCVGAGKLDGIHADRTCVLLCKTEKGNLIRLRHAFISARPDVYTYYSLQGSRGCYMGATSEHDIHKVHLRGICNSNEWRNVYDFKGFLPKEWDVYPEGFFGEFESSDNCRSQYDHGAPLLLNSFADAIRNDTTPTVSLDFALNWTAAGIASQLSAENGGESVEVPSFDI